MNNMWPLSSCLRIGLVGEPSFHHQTGFDERFEDVPEGWFLDVAGIVLILTVDMIVVVYQSCRILKRAVFHEQLRHVSICPGKRTCSE
jgi:hypothetical protein